jgi:hypothetical protein
MRKIPLSNKQKEYLRKVYRILHIEVTHPIHKVNDFTAIGYKLEMEFINRVLGDLFYTSEDRSRLNDLSRVYKEVV